MLAEERQQMILEMLKTNQFVKVQEICDQTHGGIVRTGPRRRKDQLYLAK